MLVFAHRGASGHEPENTLLAIRTALQMQVNGIEIDVHLAQGELVVIHDRWLQTTTNGAGRVSEKNLLELRQLDAGKGQKIPTLWEVLEITTGKCQLNIELKSNHTVEPLLQMLNQAQIELGLKQSEIIISSFNHHLLRDVHATDKAWKTGALTASNPIDYALFAQNIGAYSINIDMDVINVELVNDAHNRGLKVFVYTVDHAQDIADLHRMKVDGIFTNFPLASMIEIEQLNAITRQAK